jgi:hypothetical protein
VIVVLNPKDGGTKEEGPVPKEKGGSKEQDPPYERFQGTA